MFEFDDPWLLVAWAFVILIVIGIVVMILVPKQ